MTSAWRCTTFVVSVMLASGCTEVSLDLCPADPAKTEAGACGCGVADADLDGDGLPDCYKLDLCPSDPDKDSPGTCGCGVSDADADRNGIPDCLDSQLDLCPDDANKTLPGACGCGKVDSDENGNGVPDCFDPPAPPDPFFFPATCKEEQQRAVAMTGKNPTDGTYTLYVGGDPQKAWNAFCRRMNLASPIEYLSVDESANYSQISNGVGVATTSYRRLRIDPVTLKINPLDNGFATNDFGAYTPTLQGSLTSIPAGWAEFQPFRADDGPPAESRVSLAGTAFAFDDSILANSLADFFCKASDMNTMPADTTGSFVSVAADLTSLRLTAINSNPNDSSSGVYTRNVADCTDLGPSAVDFSTASWPLKYVGTP